MSVKRRVNVGATMVATPVLLLAALAGCVTTHGNLASSADRLERTQTHSAVTLARRGRTMPADTRTMQRVGRRDPRFRATLADRNADDRDVPSGV